MVQIASAVGNVWVPATLRKDGAVTRRNSKRALVGFNPESTLITSLRNVQSAAVDADWTGSPRNVDVAAVAEELTEWKTVKTFSEGFLALGINKGRSDAQATYAKVLKFYAKKG